jgi:hypothetical protein
LVKRAVPASVLSFFNNPQILLQPDALTKLQASFAARGPQGMAVFNQLVEAVKVGLATGIHNVFVFSLVLMILGLIAVLFLKEIELRGGPSKKATTPIEDVEDIMPEDTGDLVGTF